MGISKNRRRYVLERDSYSCHWCGAILTDETASIDHLLPKSKWGSDKAVNLVASCGPCNKRRGNDDPPASMELTAEHYRYREFKWVPSEKRWVPVRDEGPS